MALPILNPTQITKVALTDTDGEIPIVKGTRLFKICIADPDELPEATLCVARVQGMAPTDYLGSCYAGGHFIGEIDVYGLHLIPGSTITITVNGPNATNLGVVLVQNTDDR